MYKVFVVDDEELVIKSLIASVNWGKYGFIIEGYALSGYEAFEHIKSLKPDIVFTDIRMPGMSGLELIKNLKEILCEAIFIVVSGYAEFAYAQKAINYGALGYCLKPFDEAEISSYLKRAIILLQNTKPTDEMEIIELIDEDSEASGIKVKIELEKHNILLSPHGIYIVMTIGKTKLNIPSLQSNLMIKIGYEKYVYFIQDSGLAVLQNTINSYKGEGIKGIGITDRITHTKQIKEAINIAEMRAYHYFTVAHSDVLILEDIENKRTNDMIQRLDEAIDSNDIPKISALLEETKGYFLNRQLNIKQALILYNHVISFLARKGIELYEEYIDSYDKLTKSFSHVEEMIRKLKELIENRVHEDCGITVLPTSNRTFRELLKYVDDNFCNDISIDNISKEFYINASYVGQLFKKELGITFTEYLTQSRMNYAHSLITKTDLGLSTIAEKVGYKDYFYFSRIFKKINGQVPSHYRAQ